MAKVIFLLSHVPNPRLLKRVKTLEKKFEVQIIYWNRNLAYAESFSAETMHSVHEIKVTAPQGNAIARVRPLAKFAFESVQILKREKPNIIHAANLDMLLIAVFYKHAYRNNVRIVNEIGDLPKYTFVKRVRTPVDLVAKMLQRVESNLTKSVSKIILTSPYFWESYYSSFMDESKYLFIPNAPAKQLFSAYTKRSNKDFIVGFIGSVRYVNQLKMLIDVAGLLNDTVRVFIAGVGPGYEEIKNYVSNKPWVEMYGPYNYQKEIVCLYEKVDCVYSVYDTNLHNVRIALPNRLYEAIVCELPIIAAKDTALGDFIEQNEVGTTVGAEDSESLKSVLSKWASDPRLMKRYADNCRVIKDDYYYERNSDKLLEMYQGLIDSK